MPALAYQKATKEAYRSSKLALLPCCMLSSGCFRQLFCTGGIAHSDTSVSIATDDRDVGLFSRQQGFCMVNTGRRLRALTMHAWPR
jgi:hypothetical protein